MTFLQPFILWGLPLVMLPVIIHLINRMRHRPRQWAAMQFLLAATRSSTSHSKIKNWLILAMRILAVLLLLLFSFVCNSFTDFFVFLFFNDFMICRKITT